MIVDSLAKKNIDQYPTIITALYEIIVSNISPCNIIKYIMTELLSRNMAISNKIKIISIGLVIIT